ncbi:MAG: DAK2 domain-containing protein [Dehalococcoidia bacterium]|nr:DAK2 domain-containing protein [Dehalococcoidia bacterium]
MKKIHNVEHNINLADGQTLKDMFTAGTEWLEKSVPEINAINVFPVPDGDTGTNMLQTMRSAIDEVNQNSDGGAVSTVAKSISHGALMGARGNSGVILSQFWSGLAKGLASGTYFTAKDFANALAEASKAAYECIPTPVEGTILTVLKDAASAANIAAQETPQDLTIVLQATVKSAKESVARTPDLLPVLKEAGVVDAGGQGLYVLLDGALHYLKGESGKMQYRKPQLAVANIPPHSQPHIAATQVEIPYGYCTNFILEGQKIDVRKIKRNLKRKGQSLVVTGDESMVRVHIHSLKPGEVLNYASKLGKLHEIKIDNMDDQYSEFLQMQKERMPLADIATVVVASGEGFFQVFRSLGATIIVPGGQTMNPSVRELLQAVESTPSNEIILLPNNKNIIPSASQVEMLTEKKVKVVPTRTTPQGIASFLAFNYDMNLEENARAMEEAALAITTIEITRAIRKTHLNGLKIKKGQFIAILNDGNLISNNDKVLPVIFEALDKTNAGQAEIATIYYGAETKASEAEEIVQKIREKYNLEVELIHGGQPHYQYIISLE